MIFLENKLYFKKKIIIYIYILFRYIQFLFWIIIIYFRFIWLNKNINVFIEKKTYIFKNIEYKIFLIYYLQIK